jgi:hypothetical protein
MKDKLITTHHFSFDYPCYPGGETLTLATEIMHNGDEENNVYVNQTLSLQSYGRSASITCFNFTPRTLRRLADELEAAGVKNI